MSLDVLSVLSIILSELDLIFINVIFSYFIFHRGNEIKQTCLPMAEFHHTILTCQLFLFVLAFMLFYNQPL